MAELLEIEDEQNLSREAAAAWLRELADQLARNNQLQFRREGMKYTVRVPGSGHDGGRDRHRRGRGRTRHRDQLVGAGDSAPAARRSFGAVRGR